MSVMEGRDRSVRPLPPAAERSITRPPAAVPAGGGTARAHRYVSLIQRVTLRDRALESKSAWTVYASPDKRFVKNLSIYNRSVQDRDHDRS